MLKKSYIKLSIFVIALFVVFTVAFFKFDVTNIFSGQTANASTGINLDELKSQTQNSEIEETESPSHFSVFKFINSFVPSK